MYNLAQLYRDTGILYVDNTILSTFASCETQAMMRYGYFLQPESDINAPMTAGIAVHKALECHYLGGTVDEALSALWESYYAFASEYIPAKDRLAYNNVVEIVRSWIWHHPLHKLPYKVLPEYVEMPFCLPLVEDGSIMYVGAIDNAGTRTDGAGLYLIDTKSTGRIDTSFKLQFYLSTQMSGYMWALEELLGRMPTALYINVVDMRSVPNSNRKCYTHKTPHSDCGYLHMQHQLLGPYYRTTHAIKTWKKNAIRLAQQWKALLDRNLEDPAMIARVPQSGMFRYQVCSRCSYQDFCRNDRVMREDIIETEEPWWPGTTAEIAAALANGSIGKE